MALNNGKTYCIKKVDAAVGAVGVARAGADTIDGAVLVTLVNQYDHIWLISDGIATWHVFCAGAGGGGGGGVTEGPGIDVVGNQVGLGGDTILLYDRGGNPVAEYAATGAGMAAAIAAAAAGDVIWLPAYQIPDNHTIPADVEVVGLGVDNSELTGIITNNGTLTHLQVSGALTNNANLNYILDPAGSTQATRDLGIGLTPVSRLHIYEDNADVAAAAGFTIEQDGAGDAVAQFFLTGGQRWVAGIDNSDADKFKFASDADLNTNARLTITTTGRIGIGTTTPDGTLHVHTATAGAVTAHAFADDLVVENSGSTGISILSPDANYSRLFFGSLSDNIGAQILWSHNADLMFIGTSKAGAELSLNTDLAAEAVRIDSAGMVGIGTTSPSDYSPSADNLVIYESSGWVGMTIASAATARGSIYFADGTAGTAEYMGGIAYLHATDKMYLWSAANFTLPDLILADSKVGVNIISPAASLHVDQTSATGAVPVLALDQADVDVVLMKIIGTAAAASADRTLVADADYGTPGALVGWFQIEIDDVGNRIADGDYYVPIYQVPT